MNDDIKKVAMRLRDLREISELTTEAAAEVFGLTHEDYLKYESGSSDIPISFLYEAAGYFKIQVADLLSGNAPKLHICQYIKAGKGLKIERSRQYDYHHLAYNFAGNRVLPLLVTVAPRGEHEKISTNTHPGQEFDYCLKGQILISINGKEYILNEGDSIYYDSSFPHGMAALGSTPAEFIAIVI